METKSSAIDAPPCRYTRLPKLRFNEEIPDSASVQFVLQDPSYSEKNIISTWCNLLGTLTGDERPVFCLNNRPVRLDLVTGDVEDVESMEEEDDDTSSYAALSINGTRPCDQFGLSLRYDALHQTGTLVSKRFSTSSFLREIGSQLRFLLRQESNACQLSVLNAKPSFISGPSLLHEMLTSHCGESHIALDFLHQDDTRIELSYSQIHRLSNSLAARIDTALDHVEGVNDSHKVVPMMLPQSPELYVSWLAVLKTGAAVCPLNLDTPPERIKFILNDVSAKIVVTVPQFAEKLREVRNDITTIFAPSPKEDLENSVEIHNRAINAHNPAYVMYTSGSTGLPKGVVVSHQAATQALLAHDRRIPDFTRFLQFASPTFDVSVFEIFFPWFRGATLVGCERGKMLNNLPAVLNNMQIDAAEFTPTVAGELVRSRSSVPSLKVMLTIGEMLTRYVIDEFGTSFDRQGILHGMYGPTEAAIHCTVADDVHAGDLVGNIGVPLDTVTAFIIPITHEKTRVQQPGISHLGHIGELALGGFQLADGYLNREKENKAAFINLPNHGRIYRTGDKARIHPNGLLECLGRISTDQVKLRGQRIELGEIEQVICKTKGVRNAVVNVVDGILVAFLTIDGTAISSADVSETCKRWLPRYMVPGDFVILDKLPRLPSAKVDRKLLVADYVKKKGTWKAGLSTSCDSLTKNIISHVEEIMGAPVDVDESLASQGLDSLSAIKLSSMLRGKGLELDVTDILDADCINGLCLRVEVNKLSDQQSKPADQNEGFKQVIAAVEAELKKSQDLFHVHGIHPCSSVQIAMLTETVRDSHAYFNWIEHEFEKGIQEDEVKKAFQALAQQNEILRTGFLATENPSYSFVQIVWNDLAEEQFTGNHSVHEDVSQKILHPLTFKFSTNGERLRMKCQVHHSLYDGWSWELVCNDLSRFLSKQALPERPQFREVVSFLNDDISSDNWERATNYWRDHLQGYQAHRWPNFNSKTDVASGRVTLHRTIQIQAPEAKKIAQRLHIGTQAIFQSAFAYLMASYVGNADVVIGSVSSGRTLPLADIDKVIGPCVATVPLRFKTMTMRTSRDLLMAANNLNRQALKHESVPLQQIKKHSDISVHEKLFHGLFVWQDMLTEEHSEERKSLTITKTEDYLECALLVEMQVLGDSIQATASFDASAMPSAQAALFLHQLDQIASLIVNCPDLALNSLFSRLSRDTLSITNFPHQKEPAPAGLLDGVKATAKDNPERIAIEFGEDIHVETGEVQVQKLTYSELEISSNAVAHRLQSLHVNTGDFVAIYMEKCPELYVSMLAVVKAGAAFVPIAPSTPKARLMHILHDTHCRVVLTTTKLSAAVQFSSSLTPVNVDTFSFVGLSTSAPSISVEESTPAYVIFTSGSTGVPKGVVVTRRNLQANLSILAKKYPSEPCSKLLQACSQAFDVAVFEVFFTLSRGMTLCATTNDLLFRDIENFIRRMGITHLSMTSTVAALVHPENVPRVKFLISAGESLNSKILQNWGGKGIWQGYGPTETTNIVTLKANIQSNDQPNDIGVPLETTSVFIVADTPGFSLVPRGGVGELCFGGDQVAQGYIDMKDLTTKKFMAHPEFGRIYRTGDFGRMLPNDSLLFLGRQDDQVKFRGQRVELGEIDAVLSRQTEVLDNVTIVQPDQGEGKQQLVSFLRLAGESNINSSHDQETVKNLFNILETALPPYMVPSIMLPVPSFTLNSSGKKDWRSLLDHLKSLDHDMLDSFSRRSSFSENEDQLSETEAIIASCVSQVTNTPLQDVRKHSSFFSLGLDSISATSLSKSLKSRGLGQIDISKILIHNSVTRLAQHTKESQGMVRPAETSTQGISLLPFEITEKVKEDTIARGYEPVKVLPCTPLQEAMLARLSESDAYHNVLILELACDVRELKKSWKQAIRRHDILRTRFASTHDARNPYVQIVLRTVELPWDMITEDVNLDIENEIAGPHPTSADDLIPYHFFVIKRRNATLLKMDIHHAIYDAAAIALILKDVETSFQENVQALYPPFEDYLRYMIASNKPECSNFWKSYLKGVRSIGIDKQKSRGTQKPSFNSVAKAVSLSLGDLLGQCKEMSTTLLSILQTSWGKLLVHLSGVHDLCFGNVYSGRNIPVEGAQFIVGPCFNTLPIRANISAGSINLTVVHQLRDDNLKILPHQLTSLRKLNTDLRRESHVLFDTLLLLQDDILRLDDTVWKLRHETGAMDMPLICEVIPDKVSGKVKAAIHFDESLISRTDADTLLSGFLASVSHTVLYPYAQALDSSFLKDVGLQSVVFKPQEAPPTEKTTEHSAGKWDAKAKKIREVLSELSKVAHTHITLDTTIYQLGLDSINALQLAAQLSTLGFAISAGDILEKPSVREIAEHTLNPERVEKGDEVDTVDFEAFSTSQEASMRNIPYAAERTVKLITPCTPVQAGMLASFMNSNGNSYLNHLLLRYDIDVDMASIRKAWESAMDRHDMLRTGFFPTHSRDYPFAMITYATEPLDAHWGSVDCLSPSSEDVSLLRDCIGQEVLKNLAKPPWFVSVQNDEAGILLQFSAHHALYDAQSLSIVLSDISTIIKGGNLLEPKSIRPIHEIIVAEAQYCSSVAKAYWQSIQSNFYVTKFPDMNPSYPGLPYCTYNIASESQHTLPWLQSLCSKANVSLQAACQAAWAKILTAYLGERKVTCGIVMSGRNVHIEAEGAAFPCLVTLPTYYHVEGTNQQLLSHIMVQNAQMTRYQFTPLSKVYEWTNSDFSLFNTLFIYQKLAQNSSEPLPWAVVDERAEVDYPISLEVVPTKSTLQYNLSFRSDLLPQDQAKLILRQLDCLLVHCLTHLEDDVDSVSSLPADMISVTPAKEIEIATPCRLLHELFEETAVKSPSKVALEFITQKGASAQARQWTYAEVDREANKFARLFQQHCASQGGLIAVCFDKCPEAYMAILGVLKAGCAYVAIDPTAPAARKKFILEDSRAQLLLAISDTAGGLNSLTEIDVIIVNDPDICRVFRDDPPPLTNAISQKDPCYCLYTSGTTGTPKGCLITHDNAVQAMLAFQRLFCGHWDESSRWLQFASFHFDVSVLEQYWSWSVGICLVSCPRDLLFEDLPGTLAKLEITHIDLTPSLARLLHPDEVPSLRRGVFITGGEALRQDILDDWGPYNVIYNGYGPTEVTIGCTMFPRVPRNGKPANIGSQFDNVSSYVFRPGTTEPVLRGGVGELCVGGPLVGKGYLNRDDLTRERFISLETFNDRIYRTGDLVRLYHDDTFCFLGRQDDQIKLRGQRLEIGEINETITRSAKEIRGVATIIAKRSEKTKEQLVSFLVISEPDKSCEAIQLDLTPEAQQIVAIARRACLSALPGYMVPTHIIPLNRMPLSANNKLDAKRLKSFYSSLTPEDLQKLSRATLDTSVTLTEGMKKFVGLVADLLGLEPTKISPESNLFQLGLDSITATTFTTDLRNNGFLDVSSAQVMKNPTLSNLYRVISETHGREKSNRGCYREAKLRLTAFSQANFLAVARVLSVSSTGLERVAPCTPLQEGILYQYLQSQGKSYLANFCYEISASVSITRLKQAWFQAQKSISMLRTKFVYTENGFAQAVLKQMPFPCTDVKVSHDEDYREVVQKQFEKWVDEGNHLSSPWEITFIEGAANRLMVLNIFHAIYDGISLPHTLREVAKIYSETGYTPDKPSLLDALPWVYVIDYPAAEQFWRQHLEKQSARLLLPPDFNNYGQSIVVTHDLTDINLVEGLRREMNVTEQAIFLACWICVATHHFGFLPSLGIVVSGRAIDFDRAQEIMGPMFNTVPCGVSPSGCTAMRTLVQACHDYYASIIAYQHTSLRDIRKWLRKPPDSPLFDILFVFQKDDPEETPLEELWHPVSSDSDQDFSLSFEVQRQRNNRGIVTLATKSGTMTQDTAKKLCASFDDTLSALMQDADLPLNIELPDQGQMKEKDTTRVSSPPEHTESFEWTPLALDLREQIAQLADTDASSIAESTSIFELGLDSIDAIRLSSRLKSSGALLSVSAIMSGRTIANLVERVSSHTARENSSLIPITDLKEQLRQSLKKEVSDIHNAECILPATPLQEAMVAEMVSSNYSRYYNHDVMELAPWVDVDRLRCAWLDVIEKNPILRTRFVEVSDPKLPYTYAQVVCSGYEDVWAVREVGEDEIEEHVLNATHRYKPVDTLSSELVRLQLLTSTSTRFLVFSTPHALYDGWSLDLIHQDVHAAYCDSVPARPPYEKALAEIINSSRESAAEFWEGELSGYNPTQFPKQTHAGGRNTVHRRDKVMPVTASRLSSFCKAEKISPQALGLACWSLVYAGYAHKLDVVFGTVMLGRDSEDAEQMMFPMFNTVAFRSILHGSRRGLLRYTQERLDTIREFQHFPLRRAKAFAQNVSGDVGLFDTLFIYQRNPGQRISGDRGELYKSIGGESEVEVPVCAEMEVTGDDVVWRLSARDTVLGDEDVAALFERIEAVLEEVMNKPREEVVSEIEDRLSICRCPAFHEDDDGKSEDVGRITSRKDDGNWEATRLESKIMDALASVAGISTDEISPDQSLFHLGLDSISAIKVSSLLRKQSIFLAVSDMVKAGTVSKMAKLAREWKDEGWKKPQVHHDEITAKQAELLKRHGLDVQDVEYVLPATAGQEYMLAMHESSGGDVFYPCFVYKMAKIAPARQDNARKQQSSDSKIQERLNVAWTTLTKELPILRTAFLPSGKGNDFETQKSLYLQAIIRDTQNPVRWETEDALKKLAIPHCRRARYNAGEAPVTLHAWQGEQGEEDDLRGDITLVLRIHHALYDAVSLPLMMDTLAELYYSSTQADTQMMAAIDLKDFTRYLQERSPVEKREAFWKKYLGAETTRENRHLKPRFAATDKRVGRVKRYNEFLVKDVGPAIEQARRHGVSIQAVFLACFAQAWKKLLSKADGKDREVIVMGVYLSNRGHALDGLSQMAAPTLNIVPLRVDVSRAGEGAWRTAERVQGDLQRVSRVENSCVSLAEVKKWTGVEIDVFVNFLAEQEQQEAGMRLVQQEAREGEDHDDDPGPGPSPSRDGGVYRVGVDIEAAIRGQDRDRNRHRNRLDVGVFGGGGQLSKQEADEMLAEVRAAVLRCCE